MSTARPSFDIGLQPSLVQLDSTGGLGGAGREADQEVGGSSGQAHRPGGS